MGSKDHEKQGDCFGRMDKITFNSSESIAADCLLPGSFRVHNAFDDR